MSTENPSPTPSRQARMLLLALIAGLAGSVVGSAITYRIVHKPEDPALKPVAEKKPIYQCPMHPAIISDHADDCPICGMKLVRVETAAPVPQSDAQAVQGLAAITIDPARQQLIGLRTAPVSSGTLASTWRTPARIQVDPTRVRQINVKVEGFVERIFVDFVGQPVRKGQPLFSIYSPNLLTAQNEYLLALQTSEALAKAGGLAENGRSLVDSARRRLELWDVPSAEVERLARTRKPEKSLTMVSPIAGVVTAKNVVQGARINPGEAPYEITDLGMVWVMADAYEGDLARIHVGSKATLTLPAYPNRSFSGKVAFIDPTLDPKTRTAKVHLHFANPTRELMPEMFGEAVLEGKVRQGLRVPGDAVIHAGTREVVFVSKPDGKFEPRAVELGVKDGDLVEVKSGLTEGEQVVTRANFLVDSESQLRAALSNLGGQ